MMHTTSSKTRAVKKHNKGQQMLNDFILYSLTTLACTSFCSSPFWYPPFCATFNVFFFFFSLPKITSFLFTSKALFIVGNLIIIFLLGESKFFVSKSSKNTCYDDGIISHDKYECKSLDHQLQGRISLLKEHKGNKIIKDALKQDMQLVMILDSKTCEENDHEEFFELYDDAEDVDQMAEPSGREELEDVSCSKGDATTMVEEEKSEGVEGDGDASYPPEELNKLVDDFIARINRQRRLEAEFCRG